MAQKQVDAVPCLRTSGSQAGHSGPAGSCSPGRCFLLSPPSSLGSDHTARPCPRPRRLSLLGTVLRLFCLYTCDVSLSQITGNQ